MVLWILKVEFLTDSTFQIKNYQGLELYKDCLPPTGTEIVSETYKYFNPPTELN